MPGVAMKASLVTELQRQFNMELGAAHAYLALATWCELENFKGFARYFSKQANEERAHADKFMHHLLDRNVLPVVAALPAPKTEFRSLLEIARQAQSMEQANTQGINACYEVSFREKDYASQQMLLWFINEQVEEEDWTDEMVERVERANCAGGLSDLDRHIERYLTEEGLNAAKGE